MEKLDCDELTNAKYDATLSFQPVLPSSLTKDWNLITRPVIQVYSSVLYTTSTGPTGRAPRALENPPEHFSQASPPTCSCAFSFHAGLVLTGGGAALPGLVDWSRERLGIPVQIGVPRGFRRGAERVAAPERSCATGLLQRLAAGQLWPARR